MYPHERALVKRMANRPFALIGVNSDPKEKVLAALERENITWRSFFNGGSTRGPISKAWGVRSWPTIYVIDDRGTIRFKNVRGESMDKAVEELVERAIVTLVENIKSDDPEVRGLAAFRMGKYDAPDAVAELTKLVKDDEAVVRQRAAVGLALRGQAVKPLLPLIREAASDSVAEVRVASLESLGAAKDAQATPLAMRALEDKEVLVRRVAVTTLGQLGDPKAAPALAKAVDDTDMSTARNAAMALAVLSTPESTGLLGELAAKADHPARVWVAVAMHRVDSSGSAKRLATLIGDDDVKIRRQVVTVLPDLDGFDATDLFISAIEDEDAQVGKAVRAFLAKSDAPRAQKALKAFFVARIDKLMPGLETTNYRDRRKAQTALAALGPESAPLLLAKLAECKDRNAARTLAYVIRSFKNPAIIAPVVEHLKNTELDVSKRLAYEGTLRYVMEQARGEVTKLAEDPDSAVRLSGVRLLASLRDAEAVKIVKKSLKDEDKQIRGYAAYALSRSRDQDALVVLKKMAAEGDVGQRQMAMAGLVNYGEETAYPFVEEMLKSDDRNLRSMGTNYLGRFKSKKATEAIVKAAGDKNLRSMARIALYQQNTPAAARALGEFLKEADAREQQVIKSMLANMRVPEARKVLAEFAKAQAEKEKEKEKDQDK